MTALGGVPHGPRAFLDVIASGVMHAVPIYDQLFVGRECAGISETRRLVIADREVSRNHFEIRLDTDSDRAYLIDTSTNGSSINGVRVERSVASQIRPGDEIRVGDTVFTFRSQRFTARGAPRDEHTSTRVSHAAMVMVVGDVIDYSTISQMTDEAVVARSLKLLWQQIGAVLRSQRGTLSHYAGDALFAVWELSRFPDAPGLAVEFALRANQVATELGPELPLRGTDGRPIRMGWSVAEGMVALTAMTRSADAVIGDSANVAFRMAGLAGRDGHAPVLATGGIRRAAADRFRWGPEERVALKGRSGFESVFSVLAREIG